MSVKRCWVHACGFVGAGDVVTVEHTIATNLHSLLISMAGHMRGVVHFRLLRPEGTTPSHGDVIVVWLKVIDKRALQHCWTLHDVSHNNEAVPVEDRKAMLTERMGGRPMDHRGHPIPIRCDRRPRTDKFTGPLQMPP